MIAIFGGTTEGRVAAAVCDKAAKEFIYSTKGEEQQLVTHFAQRIHGAMEQEQIAEMITKKGVKLIIDAAHPYAQIVHQNIWQAAKECDIPVVCLERLQTEVDYQNVRYFDSASHVALYISNQGLHNILALTGVKSAATLAPIAQSNRVILRIMDRTASHDEISRSAFPQGNIIYYNLQNTSAEQNDIELCQRLGITAIVAKESGRSGGFAAKVSAAKSLNIPLLIIRRPALPQFSRTVYGEFGLRRAIEELLPEFFELRTGFTTGSAATAASTAALHALLFGAIEQKTNITLPNGEVITIPIEQIKINADSAECHIIKDGGDDPDATHQIEIIAKVKIVSDNQGQIKIEGAEGVGRVTLPGIGLEVGEWAINPVPREMIKENIARLAKRAGVNGSIHVEISVPKGEEIGAKTFNPRLGIVGGISILGTSGIVQPFSSEAFIESIERQIDIVKALGHNTIAINSGAMSERYIKANIPPLPPQCYIHYGNLIGPTIQLAARKGIEQIYIGCMIGKAIKLANGAMDTHSKNSVLDREFILRLAQRAQCSPATISRISQITTARELWGAIPQSEERLFTLIAECCLGQCKPLFGAGTLELLLIGEDGTIKTKASY